MKVTLEKLAELAGVSIATVSRVLNGSSSVSPETRLRVLEVARKSGYSGSWKMAGRPLIAIVGGHFDTRYHAWIFRLLFEELDRNEFQYEIIPVHHLALLAGRPVSGIILTVARYNLPEGWLPEVPMVGINEEEDRAHNFYSIHSDLEDGIRRVLEIFYALGHRRIALWLHGRKSYLDRSRESIFYRIAESLPGVVPKVALGREIVSALGHMRLQKVTALFAPAFDDILPIYHALELLNWKIPDEISVIVHGAQDISPYLLPKPVEFRADFEVICRETVASLKKLIAGEKVPGRIKVPYLYLPGDSIAPPPGE